MTDEEKLAIERLGICKTQRCEDKCAYSKWSKACLKALLKDIEIVLNLIEKQQAEIEEEKKKSMHYEKLITNGLASKEIVKIDEEMQTVLRTEIEKKDKIIDEMAKTLKWSFNTGLGLIPSSICDCKGDIRNCEDKICTDCIKEYFKKKVEDK